MACGGKRFERGHRAFEEAHAPVNMVVTPAVQPGMVTVVMAVRAGSAHDPVGQEGVAWLTAEAIAARGTAALREVGAAVGVEVDKEWVRFVLKVPNSFESELPGVLGHMLDLDSIDEEGLISVRESGQQWLRSGLQTDAVRLASAAYERWVYEGHPYGTPSTGRASVLGALNARSVQQFYESRYVRPAAAIGVAGAEDPLAIQAALSSLSTALYRDVTPRLVPPVDSHDVMVVNLEGDTAALVAGHPLSLTRNHEQWVALVVGVAAVGDAPEVDLMRMLLREDIDFRVERTARPEESLEDLYAEGLAHVSAVAESGISLSRFEETQRRLTAALSAPSALGVGATAQVLKRASIAELQQRIAALSLPEVNAALAEHINPAALRVVVVGRASSTTGLALSTAHGVQGEALFE